MKRIIELPTGPPAPGAAAAAHKEKAHAGTLPEPVLFPAPVSAQNLPVSDIPKTSESAHEQTIAAQPSRASEEIAKVTQSEGQPDSLPRDFPPIQGHKPSRATASQVSIRAFFIICTVLMGVVALGLQEVFQATKPALKDQYSQPAANDDSKIPPDNTLDIRPIVPTPQIASTSSKPPESRDPSKFTSATALTTTSPAPPIMPKHVEPTRTVEATPNSDPTRVAARTVETTTNAVDQLRSWKNAQGREIMAKFLSWDGLSVALQTADGTTYQYPVEKLSLESQNQVRVLVNQQNAPQVGKLSPTLPKADVSVRPETGIIVRNFSAPYGGPLQIKNRFGSGDFFIKLVNDKTGATAMEIFVRSGETADIPVPTGSFELRYAAGEKWLGRSELFGSDTRYHRSDLPFTFADGDGYSVELSKQGAGDLKTKSIKKSEF